LVVVFSNAISMTRKKHCTGHRSRKATSSHGWLVGVKVV
jgi:hypothetical protein